MTVRITLRPISLDGLPEVGSINTCSDGIVAEGPGCWKDVNRPRRYVIRTEPLATLENVWASLQPDVPDAPPPPGIHCPPIQLNVIAKTGYEAETKTEVSYAEDDACLPILETELTIPCTRIIGSAEVRTRSVPAARFLEPDRSANEGGVACDEPLNLQLDIPPCSALITEVKVRQAASPNAQMSYTPVEDETSCLGQLTLDLDIPPCAALIGNVRISPGFSPAGDILVADRGAEVDSCLNELTLDLTIPGCVQLLTPRPDARAVRLSPLSQVEGLLSSPLSSTSLTLVLSGPLAAVVPDRGWITLYNADDEVTEVVAYIANIRTYTAPSFVPTGGTLYGLRRGQLLTSAENHDVGTRAVFGLPNVAWNRRATTPVDAEDCARQLEDVLRLPMLSPGPGSATVGGFWIPRGRIRGRAVSAGAYGSYNPASVNWAADEPDIQQGWNSGLLDFLNFEQGFSPATCGVGPTQEFLFNDFTGAFAPEGVGTGDHTNDVLPFFIRNDSLDVVPYGSIVEIEYDAHSGRWVTDAVGLLA